MGSCAAMVETIRPLTLRIYAQATALSSFRNGFSIHSSIDMTTLSSLSYCQATAEHSLPTRLVAGRIHAEPRRGNWSCSVRAVGLGVSRNSTGLLERPEQGLVSRPRHQKLAAAGDACKDEDYDALEASFLERLIKAWSILFPPRSKPPNAAQIAKERLRVVLISDRGEVSAEVRRLIREKVVEAMSEFVEVMSEEEVQVKLSRDPAMGTIYSVSVPIRRVKPEWQEYLGGGRFGDPLSQEVVGGPDNSSTMRFKIHTQVGEDGEGQDRRVDIEFGEGRRW